MNFLLKTIAMFLLCYLVCAFGMSPAHAGKFILNPAAQEEVAEPPKVESNAISIDVPQTFLGIDNLTWEQIAKIMRETTAETIILRITGYGGEVMTGNVVIRAIEDAQKHGKQVIMDIIGPSYSMHAYITCFANKVVMRDGAALMFHQGASYGSLYV
jgi:ATP-dependent protease ClpP protease subunit